MRILIFHFFINCLKDFVQLFCTNYSVFLQLIDFRIYLFNSDNLLVIVNTCSTKMADLVVAFLLLLRIIKKKQIKNIINVTSEVRKLG